MIGGKRKQLTRAQNKYVLIQIHNIFVVRNLIVKSGQIAILFIQKDNLTTL